MRSLLLLHILLAVLVIIASAADNSTKPRKTLRMVKRIKKTKLNKKSSKTQDQVKSASYHVPIVVSSEDVSHVPVKLELHDDERYIKTSPDLHPIEPIHLVNIDGSYHHQQAHPVYIETKDPHYSSYQGESHAEPVYHGPVAIPRDYAPGHEDGSYSHSAAIASPDYYPENYGDLSAIPGSPGIDYPTHAILPKTGFECLEHTSTPGFYADVETKCQMWHYCQPDGRHDRFLCPNGTLFDQLTRVCNWWYNVHCDNSLSLYDINFDLYREPLKVPSQSLEITPYHQGSSSQPKSVDTAPNPNSFLSHVRDFEANLGSHSQNLNDHRSYSGRDTYIKPIQSAASPRVHRYPAKIAPAPRVVHEYDSAGPIDYDSSNAHTLSTPSEELKLPLSEPKSKQKRKIARRKLKKRQPKIYSKYADDDDIPVYREGKATPPSASRRYRVVRRRKANKD